MNPDVGIANGWALWLLLAAPLAWWLAQRRAGSGERRRIWLVTALRSLSLAFVALGLAAPFVNTRSHSLGVIYAFDGSASVQPEFLQQAVQWARRANEHFRPEHKGYVVFGHQARLLHDLDEVDRVLQTSSASPAEGTATIDRTATDLERAIEASLLGFAPGDDKRLVLITDGKQTHGNVWRALPRLQSEGVRLFSLPAPTLSGRQVRVDGLDVPEGVREREPLKLYVRLHARAALRTRVQVVAAGETLFDRQVPLVAGHNKVPVELRFERGGSREIQVLLGPRGQLADTWRGSVWVAPRLRVLQVEGDAIGADYLAEALGSQGVEVARVTAAQFARDPAASLRGADTVLLNDVPAARLAGEAGSQLERFVRDDGGGLVFVAGENAHGKDAFEGSAVERLLPVKFEAHRKPKELDLLLLIDRSGSMLGGKLESVKAAALATLDMMESDQRLAVIAFDSQPSDVFPLAEVGGKRRAEDAISSLSSGGQTDIRKALVRAFEVLKDSRSSTKHVILLSDGHTVAPPSPSARQGRDPPRRDIRKILEEQGYSASHIERLLGDGSSAQGGSRELEDLVADMAAANITLSTLSIGEEPDVPLMAALAELGSGKSYVARQDSEIPALFVTEARRLLGTSMVEETFRPVVRSNGGTLTGLDFTAGPALKGYVATRPKRFSEVLLEARPGDPVLAETRFGLGKTVAFLSDARNRWASDWLTWPGYARFWAQVVRDAGRSAGSPELGWHVTREGGWGLLRLAALTPDGRYRDGLSPNARITRPDGTRADVALRQTAPGTYVARIALLAGSPAPYRFELQAGPGLPASEIARVGVRTLHYATEDEFQPDPADIPLLQVLSERTGGKFAPGSEEIFAPAEGGSPVPRPLWPACAGAALLFFVLEIAARRTNWRFLEDPSRQR